MNKILIVGLGLIGGSIAKSIGCPVYALDRDKATLEAAQELLVSGYAGIDAVDIIPEAVILCTPVSAALAMAPELKKRFPRSLFIDCCSTKRSVQAAYSGVNYAGMHPMAGSEGSGFAYARAGLFHGAVMCVTGQGEAARYASGLAERLGGRILCIDAERHDAAAAMVSHLPHIMACALCAAAEEKSAEIPEVLELAAGGFADMTRIADSDPDMWGSIFYDNSDMLLEGLDNFEKQLDVWRVLLKSGSRDELKEHFARCRQSKQRFKRDESGIFPKGGAQRLVKCAPEDMPSLAAKALEMGAIGVEREQDGLKITCRQRGELAGVIAAFSTED